MDYTYPYDSPLGRITMTSDGEALTGLYFDDPEHGTDTPEEKTDLPVFRDTVRWLDIYFSGKDPGFTPKLGIRTTPFREKVWEFLMTIPYGQTTTYGEIAQRTADGMSARAVGGAAGHNPIVLIIPCHRVNGKDGSLTGYAGGIDRKRSLLEMEKSGKEP